MYIIVVNSSVRVELVVEAKSVVDGCGGFKKWTRPQYNYDGSVK